MENCGSFAHAAGGFPGHADALQRALARYGYHEAAALVPDCIALRNDYDTADGWSEVFEARSEAIEQRADWSYRAVIRYLADHDEDYLFSVFPFCRMEEGDTLDLTM